MKQNEELGAGGAARAELEALQAALNQARETNKKLNREKQKLEAREADRKKESKDSYSWRLGYKAGWEGGIGLVEKNLERKMADYKAATRQELRDLRYWKESAMQVFMELDLPSIGREMDLTLGSNIAEHVLPFVRKAARKEES